MALFTFRHVAALLMLLNFLLFYWGILPWFLFAGFMYIYGFCLVQYDRTTTTCTATFASCSLAELLQGYEKNRTSYVSVT